MNYRSKRMHTDREAHLTLATRDLFIKKKSHIGLFLTVIPVLKHFNALYPNCDENRAPVMHRLPPPPM